MMDWCSRSRPTSDAPAGDPTGERRDRRAFLRASCSAGAAVLWGLPAACTVPVRSHRVAFTERIAVPLARFPELDRPGGVVKIADRDSRRALYVRRLEDGGYLAVSAICTHQGCVVRSTGNGFRCPCHGSAYTRDGRVVNGPATRPLTTFAVERAGDEVIVSLGPAAGRSS